jgi:hypothetical protein
MPMDCFLPLPQQRQEFLRQQHRREQVGIDDSLEIPVRLFVEQVEAVDAGVVDQYVDSAWIGLCCRHQALPPFGRRDVGGERLDPRSEFAQPVLETAQPALLPGGEEQVGASSRQQGGGLLADAAGGTREQHVQFEVLHATSLRSSRRVAARRSGSSRNRFA